MKVHANAALGPAGRLALVKAIESGMTLRAAAAALNVSPATAHRWWHRWRAAERERARARAAGCAIAPRAPIASRGGSAPPKRSRSCGPGGRPTSVPVAWRESAAGPARRSGRCSHRHGLSQRRRGRSARPTAAMSGRSRERCCTSTSPAWRALSAPGTRSPAIRDMTGAEKRAGVGYVYLHCVIDDHSRYAYVEQHRDQGGDTAAAVLGRAIEHFAASA